MNFESRAVVGLLEPRSRPRIPGPVESLTVHYNGPAVGIRPEHSHERCRAFWRGVQLFHMGPERGWHDVAYTLAVCQHGIIMAGRGAGVRTAANGTNKGNNISYAIFCLIGGNELPSTSMLRSIGEARVGLGVDQLRHHSYWKATTCAGPHLNLWVRDNPYAGRNRPAPVPIPQVEDDMLVRIDGGNAVYHVVGMMLAPVGKEHAEVIGGKDFKVKNITKGAAAAFEILPNHASGTLRRVTQLVGPRSTRDTVTTPDGLVFAGLNSLLWANDVHDANLDTRGRYDEA